jgi:Secretion system C-terminal sorting domain/SprB repeat
MKSKFLLILLCSLVRIHALLADDVSAQIYDETSTGASNGRIILTIIGGVAPYRFSWSGPNGYVATTQNISNLKAGSYQVTISDALCGTAVLNNLVVEACALTATTNTTATCGNDMGSVSIQLQNAYMPCSYRFGLQTIYTNNNPIVQSLSTGSYNLIIEDAKGCSVNKSVSINTSPAIKVRLISSVPSCMLDADGSININVISGSQPYSFEWSDGSTNKNLDAVRPGSYNVKIRDQQNCLYSGTFNVDAVAPQVLSSTIPCGIEYRCKGNSVFYQSSTFIQRDGTQCIENTICSANNQVVSSQSGSTMWQAQDCCCAMDLVCTLSGTSLGWTPCGVNLVTTHGCCFIGIQCDCTGRSMGLVWSDEDCWDISCDREFGGLPPPKGNANTDYIILKDSKTQEKVRFTFEEIANKTYKKTYPNMPDLDLNQKTTLNGKAGTIYELLRPKKFLFSISPNPFESNPTVSLFVTSDFQKDQDKAFMTISNELGQIISQESLQNLHIGENKIQPNCNNLPIGMYLITIELKDKKEIKKMYKK